jgi:hypothetical protein
MRTILQVNQQDINEKLLQIIKMLVLQNEEVLALPDFVGCILHIERCNLCTN